MANIDDKHYFRSGNHSQDLEALKLLYIDLGKKTPSFVQLSNEVEANLQEVINDPHSDRLVLEMCCKVYFLLVVQKYNEIDLKSFVNLKSARARIYIVRGILSTRKDFQNPELLYSIITEAVETCLTENSVYTTIALNNLRLFCNNYKNFPYNFPDLWRIVAMHLSSRFTGARDEAMSILEFIVKFDSEYGIVIAQLVASEWPWTYANKFYALSKIIEGPAYNCPTLLSQLKFDEEDVVDGLMMGLKYRTLYSPGQQLLRSLLIKDQLHIVVRFIHKILAAQNIQLLHDFHVKWSKEIQKFRKEIFPLIEQEVIEQMGTDSRLVLINIFRDHLVDKYELKEESAHENVEKQHYYDILLYRIGKELNLPEDLSKMMRFLEQMKEAEDTTLRQYVFSNFPQFITGILNIYTSRKCPKKCEAIEIFVEELNDGIIEPGFQATDPTYPVIILSIRLYRILMKTLQTGPKLSTSSIKLKDMPKLTTNFNGLSQKYFEYFLGQLNSPFDDIRLMASDIIIQFFAATHARRSKIEEIFCEKIYFSSMDDSRRIHWYFKVLVPYYVTLKLDIGKLFAEYTEHLVDNFHNHFILDPLRSINGGIRVFDKINILQEIVLSKRVATGELLELVKLLQVISTKMLHFLSLSLKSSEQADWDITPSFQVIDESLQILVNNTGRNAETEWDYTMDKSVMAQPENVTNRQDLLLVIWLTLKACGDLSATIIESVADPELVELFSVGLEINTEILYRCRHKGAIEAVGLSFGRIVAHITATSSLKVMHKKIDSCMELVIERITAASYARRGAGFSFLCLNLIKNDRKPGRPLLKIFLHEISSRLRNRCYRPVHSAYLHYLSVLFNDSSLTQDILPNFEEITSVCLEKIEDSEWPIRNAALQLFGALVPKVIGQRQHSDTEWEPCQFTWEEFQATMPKIHSFIKFNLEHHRMISETLLVAILSFISNMERRPIETAATTELQSNSIDGHLFHLLSHPMEKVRALSALCFARSQRHGDLSHLGLNLLKAVFTAADPNLKHGLLLTLLHIQQKAQLECRKQWMQRDRKVFREVLQRHLNDEEQKKTICKYNELYLNRLIESIHDQQKQDPNDSIVV